MTPATFDFFAQFLKERSGLALGKEKQYLLENRLSPLVNSHGVKNFDELARKLKESPSGALGNDVVESMTVTETSFFRDKMPFELFTNEMLPKV